MNNNLISEHVMMSASAQIDSLFEQFISDHNEEPQYARCEIVFMDDPESPQEVIIKLSSDYDEDKDDDVFYYCDSINDLKSLTMPGCEDFILQECLELSDTVAGCPQNNK